jgi:hypothetical protein
VTTPAKNPSYLCTCGNASRGTTPWTPERHAEWLRVREHRGNEIAYDDFIIRQHRFNALTPEQQRVARWFPRARDLPTQEKEWLR